MPTSASENKDVVKQWILELNPQKVLDIGAGEGTYSTLARNKGTWAALEAYYPYVAQYKLEEKYDKVIVGDARYIDYGKLPFFNLIIAADMLEHMTHAEAKALIKELLAHTQYLLICFPIIHLDQHDDNNPFEEHIDHWGDGQMGEYLESIGAVVEKHMIGEILSYFLVKVTK